MVEVESYAKFLVEDDTPKIDHAVKAYLSLVAARSAVQSEIDVMSTSPLSSSSSSRAAGARAGVLGMNDEEGGRQCTFAGSIDANKCALLCARTLLSTINSTILPLLESDDIAVGSTNDEVEKVDDVDDETKRKEQRLLHNNTTRIIWNKLANDPSLSIGGGSSTTNSSGGGGGGGSLSGSSKMKPSKVLGRQSLLVAYTYIQERLRRGVSLVASSNDNVEQDGKIDTTTSTTTTTTTASSITSEGQLNPPLHALSDEVLPPALPPKGIDIDKWRAFYLEFGHLLLRSSSSNSSVVVMEGEGLPNDSALLWSKDGGAAELQLRRESRTRRAAEAMEFESGSARGEDNNE